jgi:hypothetical protein
MLGAIAGSCGEDTFCAEEYAVTVKVLTKTALKTWALNVMNRLPCTNKKRYLLAA